MKNYTKGAKLAKKRELRENVPPQGIPELKPVKRNKQARVNGRFMKVEEDQTITALNCRCLKFGLEPNEKGRDAVKGQNMCCEIGFVLEASCKPDQRSRLWDVFHRWTRAEVTYRIRYIGQREQPASASLMMIHDKMETDPSLTVDVRGDEQKDCDAINGWMRWQGFLGHLSKEHSTILHCARRGDGPLLWKDKKPTKHGLIALEALKELADVSERHHKHG